MPIPPAPEGRVGSGRVGCHCLTLLSGAWRRQQTNKQNQTKPPFETPNPSALEGRVGSGRAGCHCLTLLFGAWRWKQANKQNQTNPLLASSCSWLLACAAPVKGCVLPLLSPLLWRAPPAVDKARQILVVSNVAQLFTPFGWVSAVGQRAHGIWGTSWNHQPQGLLVIDSQRETLVPRNPQVSVPISLSGKPILLARLIHGATNHYSCYIGQPQIAFLGFDWIYN